MRIVVFGDERRVGALDGDRVVDLNRAAARQMGEDAARGRVPARLEEFIAAGQAALDDAQRALEAARDGDPQGVVFEEGQFTLHAPWPGRRIACMGGNYADHLLGMEPAGGSEPATIESVTRETRAAAQWGFWKVPSEVAGPEDEVPYPKRTQYFDYEAEAAIIIGKRGKDIPADKLADYVWGVTLLNDWSIRDGMGGQPRPMSYNLAKNFDRSVSMGPCIVVGELQPDDVDVQLAINRRFRQQFNTSDMIFSFGEVLEFLSRDFTFVPGDVISGGTAQGTAADKTKAQPDGTRPKDLFLKPGDLVEIHNAVIGTLRNRVVGG